jgi:hypothetical protein
VVRERPGGDQCKATSELLAADSGEQPRALDIDARVDERGRQVLDEVLMWSE